MEYKNIINSLRNKYNTNNIKYLNEGAEGRIFAINDSFTVKIYKKERFSFEEIQKLTFDFQTIEGTVKPKEIDTVQIDGEDYIIQTSKYMKNGDLYDIMFNSRNDTSGYFPIAFWLVLDLFYMHQNGFVHCDLRPDNILLNNMGKPKIIDLTFSKRIINDTITRIAFTQYTSPDLLQNKIIIKNFLSNKLIIRDSEKPIKIKVSDKHDIYSLGIIFVELFARGCISNVNFKKFVSRGKRVSKIAEESNEEILSNLDLLMKQKFLRKQFVTLFGSDEAKLKLLALIKNMINDDIEKRFSIEEVLREMKEIYPMVSINYEKYKINGKEYNFNIKNKEKLFSEIADINDINFNEGEIEKIDRTTEKIVNSLVNLDKVSVEFKDVLHACLGDDTFLEHSDDILQTMLPEEQKVFNRIIKRIKMLKQIKNNVAMIEEFESMGKSINEKYCLEKDFA